MAYFLISGRKITEIILLITFFLVSGYFVHVPLFILGKNRVYVFEFNDSFLDFL